MIIGITGTISSGKDTVAEIISKKLDYPIFTFSNILEKEMNKKNIKSTRKNFQNFADNLRQEQGSDVLAKLLYENSPKNNMIINGFRNLAEVKYFKNLKDKKFILISVDAPQKLRFKRGLKRKRTADSETFEEFVERDKRSMGARNVDFTQNIKLCMDQADKLIINDGSFKKLKQKIENLLKIIRFA